MNKPMKATRLSLIFLSLYSCLQTTTLDQNTELRQQHPENSQYQ